MKYRIEHETTHRIRFRLFTKSISREQAQILKYAFSSMQGVRSVTVYRQTADCAIEHDGVRDAILEKLDAFEYVNVRVLAEKMRTSITADEMKSRRLDPQLKSMRKSIPVLSTSLPTGLPAALEIKRSGSGAGISYLKTRAV